MHEPVVDCSDVGGQFVERMVRVLLAVGPSEFEREFLARFRRSSELLELMPSLRRNLVKGRH